MRVVREYEVSPSATAEHDHFCESCNLTACSNNINLVLTCVQQKEKQTQLDGWLTLMTHVGCHIH